MLDKRYSSCHSEPMTTTQHFQRAALVKFAGFPVREDGSQRRAQQYSWNAEGTEMGFVGPVVPVGTLGTVMDRVAHHTMNGGGSTYTVVFNVPGHGPVRLNGINASELIDAR